MKNSKIVLISLLTLSIMLVMSLGLFADGMTGELTSAATKVAAGQTFTVDLTFSDKVGGVDFTFVYDHDKLELVETPKCNVSEGSYILSVQENNPDKITCAILSKGKATETPISAKFKVKEGVKVGDTLTISVANMAVTDVSTTPYKTVYPEVTSWEYTLASSETGCEYVKVTTYPTSKDRENDTNGTDYIVKSTGSNYVLDTIALDNLYYKVEAIAVDSDATVTYTRSQGTLTIGKSSSLAFTVKAPDGTTKRYTVALKTLTCTHEYEEIKSTYVAPTCTEKGSVKEECKVCGDTKTTYFEKIAHNYTVSTTAPTCTEGGYSLNTCTACGDSYKSDEVAATGHSYEKVSSTSTCKVKGETTYKCSVCQYVHTEADTEFASHKYASKVIEPTCQAGGKTVHTCEICSESYEDAPTAPIAHSYETKTVDPTCTEKGSVTVSCKVCKTVFSTTEVSATGHSFGEWKTEIPATSEKDGIAKRTCQGCSESETQILPKLVDQNGGNTTGDDDPTDWSFILIIILIVGIIILLILLCVVYFTYKKKREVRAPKK